MKRLRERSTRFVEQPVNPMDSVSNLADAMLVLAVGIMLALIINWKVDITTVSQAPSEEQIALDEQDMTDADGEALDQEAMQRVGALYYDEATNTYYAVTGNG